MVPQQSANGSGIPEGQHRLVSGSANTVAYAALWGYWGCVTNNPCGRGRVCGNKWGCFLVLTEGKC